MTTVEKRPIYLLEEIPAPPIPPEYIFEERPSRLPPIGPQNILITTPGLVTGNDIQRFKVFFVKK